MWPMCIVPEGIRATSSSTVILGLGGIYFRFEYARFGPALLPFGFDLLWVVLSHAELSPSASFFCLADDFF